MYLDEVDAHGRPSKKSAEDFLKDYYKLTTSEIKTLQKKKQEDEFEEDLDAEESAGN